MGSSYNGSAAISSSRFRPQKLPIDASTLAMGPEQCHCVADAVLENRYNMLRAEEHARTGGRCGPEWGCEVAHLPENAERNRYASVVPWDHSRVLLPVLPGANDYINANWIELGSRTYIATQGPLNSTVSDFWHMVYAYGGEPAVIIMLTPLYEHAVEKCAKYWPDSKSHPVVCSAERGYPFGLTVHLKHQQSLEQYQLSTFSLQPSSSEYPTRTVHHIYYHSWLDYSKPNADADLRSLIHLVNNKLRNRSSPPIVHCSAGIGRTGTYLALDALLSRVDTDILPAVLPRVVPVWKADQKLLRYRDSVFTGLEDIHTDDESPSSSQLLSKFDVSQASRAASINETVNSTAPTTSTMEVTNASSATSHSFAPQSPTSSTGIPTARESRLSKALAQSKLSNVPENGVDENRSSSPSSAGFNKPVVEDRPASAKTGPAIHKVAANVTSVDTEVFSQTPDQIDVIDWYDPQDPVMRAVRLMRQQRPKMVQGKQQLGYIYDQLEVGLQLARATHQHNLMRRQSSISSVSSSPVISSSKPSSTQSQAHSTPSHHHLHGPGRILSLMGVRRHSHDHSSSRPESVSSSASSRKRGMFSGTVLR